MNFENILVVHNDEQVRKTAKEALLNVRVALNSLEAKSLISGVQLVLTSLSLDNPLSGLDVIRQAYAHSVPSYTVTATGKYYEKDIVSVKPQYGTSDFTMDGGLRNPSCWKDIVHDIANNSTHSAYLSLFQGDLKISIPPDKHSLLLSYVPLEYIQKHSESVNDFTLA